MLLLPALPAAALFLSWGKITGSSQRGLVLISHPSHAGCWSHGESVPSTPLLTLHSGWWNYGFHKFLHPPFSCSGCIYLSRPGNVIRGSRSQDASPTSGSWQEVWAQQGWIPQLSHTLWEPCSASTAHSASPGDHLQYQVMELKRTAFLFYYPPRVISLPCNHFHFSLPVSSESLTRAFPSLVFAFGWVGFKAGLDSSKIPQSWFFSWLFFCF